MKNFILTILAMAFCIISCNNKKMSEKDQEIIIDIATDANDVIQKQNVTVLNSDEDIVGFMSGNHYVVKITYSGLDTIKTATAYWGDSNRYNKAKYIWITDTSISITLYNSISDSSAIFRVSGTMDGRGSGLSWD
tara:strand:- start:92 stop:496 length:405 start_codon:yes stop_codon:yes gene_type:complete